MQRAKSLTTGQMSPRIKPFFAVKVLKLLCFYQEHPCLILIEKRIDAIPVSLSI